ncbi:MAG: hypothetical protein QG657_2930 [Acidobacteriota bacterium]|nr:hypothetical protein [Acidobacteriota bacterium]
MKNNKLNEKPGHEGKNHNSHPMATQLTPNQTLDTPLKILTPEDIDRAEKEVQKKWARHSSKKIIETREAAELGAGGFGNVDEHSGCYSYKIKVTLPQPQNDGPLPEISMVYNSMRSGSASLVGAGWRLELGQIERLSLFEGKVDFKNNQGSDFPNDHFILHLNGQTYTMVNVFNKPNEFRVKIEKSFAKAYYVLSSAIDPVSQEPEIDYWMVITADGVKYKFGVKDISGEIETGGELRNKIWSITSIESLYGQKVLYEYETYKNSQNTHWKEMGYSYPIRIKCGVLPDSLSWDSQVDFIYTNKDPIDPYEGYGNLGVNFTGRELPEENGYTCILWKRLVKIQTLYKDKSGQFSPDRQWAITAGEQNGVMTVHQVREIAFKNGSIDNTAEMPPHNFSYIFKDEANPALIKTTVTPMNKTDEIHYELASEIDKGKPESVDDVYLVKTYTEKVGNETWAKSFDYWDGKRFLPFAEFRGHSRVDILEQDTGLRTENHYIQNGAQNGYLRLKISYDASGKKISSEENEWRALDFMGGRYLSFIMQSTTIKYAEDGNTVLSTAIKKVAASQDPAFPWGYALDRFGNVIQEILETHEGPAKGKPARQEKTDTDYLNVEEGDYRLIGLPTQVKKYARLSPDQEFQLVEWAEKKYNNKGQVLEKITHYDRGNSEKKFNEISEYHPFTGKVAKKYRFDGSKNILVEENRYFETGPYQFLKNFTFNALGHVEEVRHYDLQVRKSIEVVQMNKILARFKYDGMGRMVEELYEGKDERDQGRADANKDSARYTYTITPNERSIKTLFIFTDQRKKEFIDPLNRKYRILETGYKGKWIVKELTEFDHKTRKPRRIYEPHYEGEIPAGSRAIEYNDARLRETKETHATGKILRFLYNGFIKSTLEDVFESTDDGKPGKLIHTQLVEEETKNALDQVIKKAVGGKNPTQFPYTHYEIYFNYDAAGRLVRVADSLGLTLETSNYGNRLDDKVISSTDISLGNTTTEYDGLGRVKERKRDFKGSLDRVTSMAYDNLDRLTTQKDRDTTAKTERVLQNKYDTAANGIGKLAFQEVKETSGLGNYTQGKRFEYDGFGLPAVIFHRWDVSWKTKDAAINKSLEVRTDYFHNGKKRGRLEKVSQPVILNGAGKKQPHYIIEYIYDDASGLVEKIQWRNEEGKEVTPLWEAPAGQFTPRNQVILSKLGNGIETHIDYISASGRLREITCGLENSPLLAYRLCYDTGGNVLKKALSYPRLASFTGNPSERNLAGTFESVYQYDDKNQLVTADEGGHKQVFVYRANGSRTHWLDNDQESRLVYDNSKPHQPSMVTGEFERRFFYDSAGNMVRDENKKTNTSRVFTWNCINKVQRMEFFDAQRQEVRYFCYGYDGEMKRSLKYDSSARRLTFYIDDLGEVDFDVPGNKEELKFHILNSSRRVATARIQPSRPAAFHYYHRDLLNSVIMVTGENGNALDIPLYEAFGKVIPVSKATGEKVERDILYTGHYADVEECCGFYQYDFKARLYDPGFGFFLSPDEVKDNANAAFGYNRYVYVNNNPTSKWDPTGNEEKKETPPLWKWLPQPLAGWMPDKVMFGIEFSFPDPRVRPFFGSTQDPFYMDDIPNQIAEGYKSMRDLFSSRPDPSSFANAFTLSQNELDVAFKMFNQQNPLFQPQLFPPQQQQISNSSFSIIDFVSNGGRISFNDYLNGRYDDSSSGSSSLSGHVGSGGSISNWSFGSSQTSPFGTTGSQNSSSGSSSSFFDEDNPRKFSLSEGNR